MPATLEAAGDLQYCTQAEIVMPAVYAILMTRRRLRSKKGKTGEVLDVRRID
jgi:hypothetical protein